MFLIYYYDKDTNDWWPDDLMSPADAEEIRRIMKYLPDGVQAEAVSL